MIRVSVMYPATAGARFDHAYYHDKHAALIRSKLADAGLRGLQMDRGVASGSGGAPAFVAVAHMLFDSVPAFQQAMGANGAALMGDVPNYTDIKPVMLISEVEVQ